MDRATSSLEQVTGGADDPGHADEEHEPVEQGGAMEPGDSVLDELHDLGDREHDERRQRGPRRQNPKRSRLSSCRSVHPVKRATATTATAAPGAPGVPRSEPGTGLGPGPGGVG